MPSIIKPLAMALLIVTIKSPVSAQELPDIRDISKLTFFNPGLSYEKRIGKFQSLYGQVFMNTSISIGYSDALGNMSSIYFDPALTLQYRYYYNYDRREARGKPTKMNNLNYVAGVVESTFSYGAVSSEYVNEEQRRPVNRFGVVWGLQRNFPKRFSVDFNIGPGYLIAKSTAIDVNGYYVSTTDSRFIILGQLNIGIWLNRRN